jgi:hypothetical protein
MSIQNVIVGAVQSVVTKRHEISENSVAEAAESFVALSFKVVFKDMSSVVRKVSGKGIPVWVDEVNHSIQTVGQHYLIELSGIKQDPQKSLVLFGRSTKVISALFVSHTSWDSQLSLDNLSFLLQTLIVS